mmetsp:Transcript_18677/g.47984  ORF Transcript_18677/g.47984 Transcript_18677/m.47984 type:complete len:390 (-) Transcript_18677:458-1627(-)
MAVRARSAMAAATKMEPAMDKYRGAFNTIGHLLCAPGIPTHPVWEVATTDGFEGMLACKWAEIPPVALRTTLADLADGPYYVIAAQLGAADLRNVDAACRLTRDLNRVNGGPWCNLGRRAFLGMELAGTGVFDPEEDEDVAVGPGTLACRRLQYIDWKGRYQRFLDGVIHFRSPFTGAEITAVDQADEIAYCRCKLRTDLLNASSGCGVYLEVEVRKNPDNVSLAIVDFEAGGCSSVTFSPDTGAVIRERKIRESPRKVEGTYIQPLTTITSGQGFEGVMGLYIKGGHVAFFRRHAILPESGDGEVDAVGKEPELGPWECTGFVTDLSWAEGKRLTPCLAFRDIGAYQVCMTRVDAGPPIVPQRSTLAYEESNWRSLDWDAGEQEALEV